MLSMTELWYFRMTEREVLCQLFQRRKCVDKFGLIHGKVFPAQKAITRTHRTLFLKGQNRYLGMLRVKEAHFNLATTSSCMNSRKAFSYEPALN